MAVYNPASVVSLKINVNLGNNDTDSSHFMSPKNCFSFDKFACRVPISTEMKIINQTKALLC